MRLPSRFAILVLLGLLAVVAEVAATEVRQSYVVPPSSVAGALYPAWAHSHWVWFSASQSNQSKEINLVADYLKYGVPVGGLDVDSQWSTCENNFQFNNVTYPDMAYLIEAVHAMNVRVIFWATSLIDTNCDTYETGERNKYYLRGLDGIDKVKWWHGTGSFIDYTNPDALQWWHSQLDNLISIGADGWKCDGTDPYVFEMVVALGYKDRIVTEREYADMYYGDFWNYTRTFNDEALIMSRPVDSFGEIYLSFSPRDVVFSGWVGDQDPNFEGLQNALRNMFHSAWRHYVGFGSDIGGYRGGNGTLGRTKELLLRWAQMGAFCALMENGGDDEHRPWIFDEYYQDGNETLDIYRNFVFIHQSLLSYLLSAGASAYENDKSIMTPLSLPTEFTPFSWDYYLGDDILVCPIVVEAEQSPTRKIDFPLESSWIDWWNTSTVYQGGSSIEYDSTNLAIFPVFHRQGSILPIEDVVVGQDHHAISSDLTFLIFHPTHIQDSVSEKHIVVRRWKGETQEVSYRYDPELNKLQLIATAHSRRMSFRIIGIASSPSRVVDSYGRDLELMETDPDHIQDSTRLSLQNPYPAYTGLEYLHVPSTHQVNSWHYDSYSRQLELLIPDVTRGLIIDIQF